MKLTTIHAGYFRLDGGAMFGGNYCKANMQQIDATNLPAGVYYVSLSDHSIQPLKLVIIKQ